MYIKSIISNEVIRFTNDMISILDILAHMYIVLIHICLRE